jgi:hypothetical protein
LSQIAGLDQNEYFLTRIWVDRLPEMLTHMQTHKLLIYAHTNAFPTDNATQFLQDTIKAHLNAHSLVMPQSRQPNAVAFEGQTNEQGNFYRLPWKLVSIGYRKTYNAGPYHLISNSSIPYHAMTWHQLFSNAQSTVGKELRRLQNINNRPLILIGETIIFPSDCTEH